jgi:cytochrome c oxidase assembly protein subunit 15
VLARLRRPISPAAYRKITMVALVLLVAIVVTGAGVRLTGSGLGCTDWPKCTETTFTPTSDLHAQIEFWNRMITGLVSAAVAAAVLGSLRRSPRRKDLTRLSLGQIVLGGLVVLTHLNPWLVQGHFVLSMVLVANAVVLTHRAGQPDGVAVRPIVTPSMLTWGKGLVGLATVVLLTGTLVTGSGPHSGHNEAAAGASAAEQLDAAEEVRRLPIDVGDAARIHGAMVWVFLGAAVWVLVQLRRHQPPGRLLATTNGLITVIVLQGALGYTQYFTGVPAALVALHILGASLVWIAVIMVLLHMRAPVEQHDAREAQSGGGTDRVDPVSSGDRVS